ncbi:Gfo/Idh/MocA family oxidoreductase [Stieleria sp. JC731]|uniref:Gfo/Idh/MocA family protein n=1 Tax=Pirellulaceae TaxID=2691357 RepID=UPI001E2E969E|nr:Gfo/Idh/MocA family oxidoreductase [Stieleria sp. JC731]MCC9603628.1 Gfo/Idh/MocA family oxidoreductase [Stieleria sp. JC731]
MSKSQNRRVFIARCAATATASTLAYNSGAFGAAKNDRPILGLIGAGYQPETKRRGRGIAIGLAAAKLGDISMLCEVDSVAASYANENVCGGKAKIVDDYKRVLDEPSIEAVLIGTPDHWHAKIAIEAMKAGKDVYCEKPVAVTIEEGKWLRDVAAETGRVFQVGTQQRTEYNQRFLKAIAMVRGGRLGKIDNIRIGLNEGWKGGPFESAAAPPSLNWERWLGPAPMTEYIPQRTHRTFRWWFEYAGGQLCDWGAHHVDIAQWAIGQHHSGPTTIETSAELNQPYSDGMPTRKDSYNTPVKFTAKCGFDNDITMLIDSSRNGITFEGSRGRIFVNRGTLEGKPVDELADNPLPANAIEDVYGSTPASSHMQNFVDCLRSRKQPISDIASHHRTLTTCHLANISIRVGRSLRWDPKAEQIVGDDVANALLSREYRHGYEIQR